MWGWSIAVYPHGTLGGATGPGPASSLTRRRAASWSVADRSIPRSRQRAQIDSVRFAAGSRPTSRSTSMTRSSSSMWQIDRGPHSIWPPDERRGSGTANAVLAAEASTGVPALPAGTTSQPECRFARRSGRWRSTGGWGGGCGRPRRGPRPARRKMSAGLTRGWETVHAGRQQVGVLVSGPRRARPRKRGGGLHPNLAREDDRRRGVGARARRQHRGEGPDWSVRRADVYRDVHRGGCVRSRRRGPGTEDYPHPVVSRHSPTDFSVRVVHPSGRFFGGERAVSRDGRSPSVTL